MLRAWLVERQGGPDEPLFPTSTGRRLSRDAVALALAKYAKGAQLRCPSLKRKSVTPHILRHSCAMALHREGVSEPVIALWLGHESAETVQIYVHADMAIKERALARTTPPRTAPGRYRAKDPLLAFLQGL